MSVYNKAVKKKLLFKGEKPAKSNKKRKISDNLQEDTGLNIEPSEGSNQAESNELTILNGTGRITSSGTTVHGHSTGFMEELSVGDAIIIVHPATMQEETKIVKMVLSSMSIGISSAFSSDLITTTSFKYIKVPKDESGEADDQNKGKKRAKDSEEEAFGTYASAGGHKFVYRERKPGAFGGYKIVQKDTGGTLTREELLNMRSKKKADRFCY